MSYRTKASEESSADASKTTHPLSESNGSTDTYGTETNRDALTLDYLITIIGFGLCRAWIIFCLGAPLVAGATTSNTWLYLVFGALSALAISFAVNRDGKRESKVRIMLMRFTPFALLASGILVPVALWLESEPLIALGFVVGGLGAGSLQVLWGDRFASHSTRFATYASPAAAIITALVAALSTDHTSFIGFGLIPLLSFALLVFEAGRAGLPISSILSRSHITATRDGETQETQTACKEADAPNRKENNVGLGVGKLMFSIMIFSILCRLFDATPVQNDPFSFLGGSAMFALILVGVVFLTIVARFKERFNPTFTYRLSLPIMVAGFVAIALFFDTHTAVSILLINVGYEFFDILAWVLFVEVSKRRNENALHIFGLGVTFMFAGMALGTRAGCIIDAMVASGDLQITMVAMLATLCLVVVAFMVLPEGVVTQLSSTMRASRKDKDDEESGEALHKMRETLESDAGAGRIEQHCACVAHDFGLTPRESEVIVLLAYGRTLSIIARDLQIAKGTARTHIENIYRKLDVHKQQELIDLVEGYDHPLY